MRSSPIAGTPEGGHLSDQLEGEVICFPGMVGQEAVLGSRVQRGEASQQTTEDLPALRAVAGA